MVSKPATLPTWGDCAAQASSCRNCKQSRDCLQLSESQGGDVEIGAGPRELVGLTRAGWSTRRRHYDPLYPTPHQLAGAPSTWNALVVLLSAGS